jgi:RNA polymerase sigma factor for flagellar operon FliA
MDVNFDSRIKINSTLCVQLQQLSYINAFMGRPELIDSLPWANSYARSCASRFPSYVDRDDLHGAGLLAYVHAASRYQSGLGASFRGYCATRIRGAVLDELRRWTWAPRSVLSEQRRLHEAEWALSMKLQREPSRTELALEMGIEVTELENIETHCEYRQVVSLDEISPCDSTEEPVTLAEKIPDGNIASSDKVAELTDDRRMLIAALHELPKREATVIVLHYLQNVPLAAIAKLLDVTPSRISQLHHVALDRMRRSIFMKGSPPQSPSA